MVLVIKSGASKVYENGVEITSSTQTFTSLTTSANVCAGRGYNNGRFFNGDMDDIRIYSIALTESEIQALYYEGGWTDVDEPANTSINFRVSQNYPNPFNPSTTIEFSLNSPEKVTINIYDINGRLIRNLFNEELVAGTYTALWEGTDNFGNRVASGTYFYRINSENSYDVKKMILLK